jgi:hypothetical protein
VDYELEDGSGPYELEDGSGTYQLEEDTQQPRRDRIPQVLAH